jgi:tetratricopeptide (TPR) repeat protein
VARQPDQHPSLYELTLLASDRLSMVARLPISGTRRKELDDHILVCTECRELLAQEQFLLRMARRVPIDGTADPGCPSEQQWMEFAAGLHSPAETQERFEHAGSCGCCSARLQQASDQFADDVSDEEQTVLDGLASTNPSWQKDLARQMQAAVSRTNPASPEKAGWGRVHFLRSGIAMASAALVLSAIGWFTYLRPSRSVNRLLALAYSEQRTTDLRMIGSRYAPVETFRGSQTPEFRRPTALLEAEVIISKALASKPDGPFWLDAQARADLMEASYSSALPSLERARRYAPDNPAIRIDLASAYFLRGEELKRPEDYGRAVDLLGQVLSNDPNNEVARFNRAVASERLLLYDQAAEDWRRYLEIDPGSRWSEEARNRLAGVEEKINQQRKRSERPLLGPAEFVSLTHTDQENAIKEIDSRAERYFEAALVDWMPQAFSSTHGIGRATARNALGTLSGVLATTHRDYWLADFLNELEQKPLSRTGVPYLTDSLRFNQIGDFDRARKSALDAANSFRKSRNHAGALIAEFESSYADQLAHQVSNCLAEARARADPRVADRYPWLQAQLALEAAACTNLNDETARALASEALFLAKSHHYSSLELRALTFLAALYQYMGDTSSAWRYSSEGLARTVGAVAFRSTTRSCADSCGRH